METGFFLRSPAAAAVARQQLAADAEAARLSRAFRAYYRLRPLLPLTLRQRLQRSRAIQPGARWCFPDAFLGRMLAALESESPGEAIIHPWPGGRRFGFVLTHDVETKDGLRNVPALAEIEERLGFRSSWNIVPYKYNADAGLVRDLQARSFEIGIHGYNHDGRLYSSKAIFQRRAVAINQALGQVRRGGLPLADGAQEPRVAATARH